MIRGVAQLASALAWGARGRKFESSHPDIEKKRSTVSAVLLLLLRHRVAQFLRRFARYRIGISFIANGHIK